MDEQRDPDFIQTILPISERIVLGICVIIETGENREQKGGGEHIEGIGQNSVIQEDGRGDQGQFGGVGIKEGKNQQS